MHRTLVTAGHVDHGKSTLVRALTGMEPDRLAEERRRGLTIELGYAWTDLADAGGPMVAFVDVPGHERLVRTMLAGAGAAPAALFVVAADDGWSAQSTEHRDLLDLLEVPVVTAVVSKCDRVDEDRVGEVVAEVGARLAAVGAPPVVPTDAVSGRGITALRRRLATGLEALAAPAGDGRARLWVDRSFSVSGAGTVVTGTLTGAGLRVGEQVTVLPGGRAARVRGLQALGVEVATASAGMRVAVVLAGVDRDEAPRGHAVVADGPWHCTSQVDVWLRVLAGERLDRAGAWTLHVGTAAVPCRVSPLTGPLEGPVAGAVRVRLSAPLPLLAGDRVVLREAGRRASVAGGRVADPAPAARPRGADERARHAALVRDAASASASREGRVEALLRLEPSSTRPLAAVRAAVGLPGPASSSASVAVVGDRAVLRETLDAWTAAATAGLGPSARSRPEVETAVTAAGAPAALAPAVVERLVSEGVLVRADGGLVLAAHADTVAGARSAQARALLDDLAAEPFHPPDLDVLAARHGVDHQLRNALVGRGLVVRAGPVSFAGAAVPLAVRRLVALEASVGPFTASQARQAWGTTRRFAIPLLEHLDAAGLTRFDGRLRQVTDRGRGRAGQSAVGPS